MLACPSLPLLSLSLSINKTLLIDMYSFFLSIVFLFNFVSPPSSLLLLNVATPLSSFFICVLHFSSPQSIECFNSKLHNVRRTYKSYAVPANAGVWYNGGGERDTRK